MKVGTQKDAYKNAASRRGRPAEAAKNEGTDPVVRRCIFQAIGAALPSRYADFASILLTANGLFDLSRP